MKKIRKLTKYAATSLLAGLTLTGAAAAADLGDYPKPFVDEDGTVDAQIVVGENAKTADVVGAIDIAGSLAQDASETETVTVSGSGSGWSATPGVSLDTRNDELYFNDKLTAVRDTLTNEHLETLKDTTFQDDSGDETEVESFIYPSSNKNIKFGKPSDRDQEDPVLYVDNPADPNTGDFLYRIQANFEDDINFTDSDVENEEIELFGRTYTISTDTNSDELVLLGSQDLVTVDKGNSKTITIDGEEHTVEVVGVTSSDTVAFKLDGELMEKDEEETFTVEGQEVRVDEVIQTNSDQSDGTATFALGSEETTLQDGNPVQNDDDDDIDGTHVEFDGSGDYDESQGGLPISSIDIYVGAEDDDKEYVMAGESYSHSLLENFEFHFGGLNPDVMEEGEAENIEFGTSGDETATVSYTSDSGDDVRLEFADGAPTPANTDLADSDGDIIHVFEGIAIQEDEYFTSDAGDFSHMWEVTNIDRDSTSSFDSSDEATVDLKDKTSGANVEVDLDYEGSESSDVYEGTEVIDGQTYKFELDATSSDPNFYVAWGPGSSVDGGNHGVNDLDVGNEETLYPALDSHSGAAVVPNQHGFGPLLEAPEGSSNASITVTNSDGTNADHDVNATVDSDTAGSSLASLQVDYNDSAVDNSNVDTNSVNSVHLSNSSGTFDIQNQLSGVSTGNNGQQVTFSFSGPSNLEQDAELSLNFTTQDSSGDLETSFSEIDINHQSSGASYTGGGGVQKSQVYELPTTESTDEAKVNITVDGDGRITANPLTSSVTVRDGGSSVSSIYDHNKVVQVNGGIEILFHNAEQLLLRSSSTDEEDLQTHVLGTDDEVGVNAFAPRSVAVIQPENDADEEEAYVVGPGYDTQDNEINYRENGGVVSASTESDPDGNGKNVTGTSAQDGEVAYPGSFSQATLESNDDIKATYDVYGAYSELDEDEQGSFKLWQPMVQATAGVGFTQQNGELSASGGGSGSVETMTPTGWPDVGMLDSEVGSSERTNSNMILVGGPAVNGLVSDLAESGATWSADQYSQGQAIIQLTEGFDGEGGNHALVVAGAQKQDTREAASYISNYADHQDELAGKSMVELDTGQ